MILDMMHDEMPDFDWAGDWTGFPFEMGWMILAMVLGGIILLIVYIALARFVYTDAVKREVPNPGIWVFIFLIFNIPGLIIYFLVRGSYSTRTPEHTIRPSQAQVHTYYAPAPTTQAISLTKAKKIAPTPTTPSVSSAKFCSMCGNKVDREGTQFCAQCGNKI